MKKTWSVENWPYMPQVIVKEAWGLTRLRLELQGPNVPSNVWDELFEEQDALVWNAVIEVAVELMRKYDMPIFNAVIWGRIAERCAMEVEQQKRAAGVAYLRKLFEADRGKHGLRSAR